MIETIISKDIEFLNNAVNNREKYFAHTQDFTRNRTLDYRKIAGMLINLPRKTLAVEIQDFLEQLDLEQVKYTKSAFSHARLKLNPCFFQDWYTIQNKAFYEEKTYQTWEGFRLMGVDGSRGYLTNTPALAAAFGTQDNQHSSYPMYQFLIGQDLLNNLCLFSDIAPVNTSETAILLPWLDHIDTDILCIYDRLFVSAMLCYLHIQKKIEFLMRCKVAHNQVVKDFVQSESNDEIVTFTFNNKALEQLRQQGYPVQKGDGVMVRLIRVILDSGETEVLVTSLLDDKKYPTQIFKGLYAKRWGVETGIGCLKNQLQIEITSGLSPTAVRQDFFASIFTYNLQSIIINSVKDKIDEINERREHDYQVNRNVTLGILKGRMVRLFINPKEGLIKQLQDQFVQHLTENNKDKGIRNPRNKKSKRVGGKYKPLLNYKRAI